MEIQRMLPLLKNLPCQYYGPASEEVFAVEEASRNTRFQPGVLYIHPADSFGYANIYENLCFLTTENYHIPRLLERTRQLLLEEARFTSGAPSLQSMLSRGESADHVVSFIAGLLHNPVLLLGADGTALANSGFHARDVSSLASLKAESLSRYEADAPCILLEGLSPRNPLAHSLLITRVQSRQQDMFLLTAEEECAFTEGDTLHRLTCIHRIFAATVWNRNLQTQEMLLQNLLFQLLQSRPSHPEDIKKQLKKLGFPTYDKYYVLGVYRKLQNCPGSLRGNLEKIIGEQVYEFGDYYIAFLHSDWKTEIYATYGRNFPELTEYVNRMDLYASLSYGVFDITDISIAMKQTVRCIEIMRKFHWNQRINGYGDMVVSHLIDTALNAGEITLDSICNPITLKIREYDRQNGTDLLEVLAAYIYRGLSVKEASEYLHMHINTVYQRIHRLEDEFGIDFSNRRLVTMLHISVIVMAYRGDYQAEIYQ